MAGEVPDISKTAGLDPASHAVPHLRSARTGSIVAASALVSALVTFLLLTGFTPIPPTQIVVVSALCVNAVLVLALLIMVVREIVILRRARRSGQAASRLHERVVRLFVIVASIPVIVVAVAAYVTLDRGLDGIFSSGVRQAVGASAEIGNSYISEQVEFLRSEAGGLTQDIARVRVQTQPGSQDFGRFLTAQALTRGFAVVRLISGDGTVIDRADVPLSFELTIPTQLFEEAKKSDDLFINIGARESRDFIEAVLRLRADADEFLYLVRPISSRIAQQIRVLQSGIAEFQLVEQRRVNVQLAFALIFIMVALLVTLSAVYLGLGFANRLVQPIRRLIGAAGQVAGGNLAVEVHIRRSEGDLASLGDTFNKMTAELREQRDDLIAARDQIDMRRRFTEAVLAGVTAGVIGLDEHGRINLYNRTAAEMLGQEGVDLEGRVIAEIVPEIGALVAAAESGPNVVSQGQLTLIRGGRERTLVVRIASERDEAGDHGAVVTVDDVTDLVVAQRTSAWADIARRIAHEIKNPLTPIQLSAERLRRRYGRMVTEDREVFDQCVDTIVRQVGDIGRMVDEFSSFARMPKAVFAVDDVAEMVRQVVFLMRLGAPDVTIDVEAPEGQQIATFDRRLVSQALTNIVKNATEAIEAVDDPERGPGRVIVRLVVNGPQFTIDVIDNGIGLPTENRHRLLEPYVTTRAKGTGLGLAIVGKILEEHGGGLDLLDAPAGPDGVARGAMIRLRFKDQASVDATQAAQAAE